VPNSGVPRVVRSPGVAALRDRVVFAESGSLSNSDIPADATPEV